MKEHEFKILFRVVHRLAEMQAKATTETVRSIIGDDATEGELSQLAVDRAVEGDYLGAMICEEAAKEALAKETS